MDQCGLGAVRIRKWRSVTLVLCFMALMLSITTFPSLLKENTIVKKIFPWRNFEGEERLNSNFGTESPLMQLSVLEDHLPEQNFARVTAMNTSKGFLPSTLTEKPRGPSLVRIFAEKKRKNITSLSILRNNSLSIPTELPELLLRLRPQLLKDVPRNYSSEYKNPCYFTKDGNIHCLPYYFLLGTAKSGTTDLFHRICRHPDIVNHLKENHWWARGSIDSGKRPLQEFLDRTFTTYFWKRIEDGADPKRIIIGDGSPSTFWDVSNWKKLYPEYRDTGPPYMLADFIYALLPNSKHLVTFRDPTTRLQLSPFRWGKSNSPKTPELFHEKVLRSMDMFSSCLQQRSLRACTYEAMVDFNNAMKDNVRLWIGIYDVFTKDWLNRFPSEQFMAIKLEEWSSNCTQVLPEIYKFLDIADLPVQHIYCTCSGHKMNVQRKNIAPMLNSTREILRDFYRPYVKELANILQDDKFLWDY